MKYFLLLATCCLTVECQAQNNWFIPRVWRWFTGGPSYYTVNQLPAGFDRLDVTELDDTFDTYVRMICKEQKNVGDGNFSAPCNCSDSLLPGRKRDTVETEIMLVSDTYNQVIVINYLKNKREKVYTDAIRPRIGPGLGPKSYANVNIFKLNQIRFGTLKGSMGDTLYFRVNSKDGREEYWDLRRKEIHPRRWWRYAPRKLTGLNTKPRRLLW
ncbi:hypothetical protein MKQ70_02710 [Chitinophaga sedimenti]|uniref:hypothetical protein n=1 Tax=Chitinophaga sedimenti TaxID=2033606 RepID=UPI002004B1E0|nr:hypothetical protein [Chitinophaga sedimenti]MCK7553975.1 hypothetical protein [Chitinophaga sedimenti]